MTNTQPPINQSQFPGHASSVGRPPQVIPAGLPEFTVEEYYNALPPQQGRPDQRPSHAAFPPNTNQSSESPHPTSQNATNSPHVTVRRLFSRQANTHVTITRRTPRRANTSRYLTSERGLLQNSTAEERFIAAGIAPPSQTSTSIRRPGIPSGRHDGELRNRDMTNFTENVIAINERHPDASPNEIANLIQEHLNFEPPVFQLAILYRREQYHHRMWIRFCHEYLRLQLGLEDDFSDAVLQWLALVVSISIGRLLRPLRCDWTRRRAR